MFSPPAAVVARSGCVRRIPLLIVHGLMWAESVVLAFFVAHLSAVSAARVFFFVDGEARCRAVGLQLGVALLSVFRLLPVMSVVSSNDSSTGSVVATVDAAHVIRGNECVVYFTLRGRPSGALCCCGEFGPALFATYNGVLLCQEGRRVWVAGNSRAILCYIVCTQSMSPPYHRLHIDRFCRPTSALCAHAVDSLSL
jgi:hypothetical protein